MMSLSRRGNALTTLMRFTRNNVITEGFHNKMELVNRQAS